MYIGKGSRVRVTFETGNNHITSRDGTVLNILDSGTDTYYKIRLDKILDYETESDLIHYADSSVVERLKINP